MDQSKHLPFSYSKKLSLQENGECLKNSQFVLLRHCATQQYLHSEGVPYAVKSGLFGSKETDKYLVGAVQGPDINSLWQVVRVVPPSQIKSSLDLQDTDIWYDDFIYLRHYLTSRFLTSDANTESPTTKQGLLCCMDDVQIEGQQIFMIQRLDDPYLGTITDSSFNIDNKVYEGRRVRIVNVFDDRAVHSHNRKIQGQKNQDHLLEATSFLNRDENDYWEIRIPTKSQLDDFKVKQTNWVMSIGRCLSDVRHQDRVIIRSVWTGGSLHSHQRFYKSGTRGQEVTWRMTQPRNSEDWWQIIVLHEDQNRQQSLDLSVSALKDNKITNKAKIMIIHCSSDKHLSASTIHKNPSGSGLEVSCTDPTVGHKEWQIMGVNCNLPNLKTLPAEYPFLIQHVPTRQYLGVYKKPSNPSDGQGEIGLYPQPCYATIWQVEQLDSIFV